MLVEAADLAALIKALKLKHVNLVGTSMGAATALTMAVEYPKLVRSLVLAEPPLSRGRGISPKAARCTTIS